MSISNLTHHAHRQQIFTRDELQVIADLCVKHDTLCFSDEVYEWLVYKGHSHIKIGTAMHLRAFKVCRKIKT